jgi:hypothetical protein
MFHLFSGKDKTLIFSRHFFSVHLTTANHRSYAYRKGVKLKRFALFEYAASSYFHSWPPIYVTLSTRLQSSQEPLDRRHSNKLLCSSGDPISTKLASWSMNSKGRPVFVQASTSTYTSFATPAPVANMPVIFASLIFAISLSLLPYTESQSDEAEMDRLKIEYLNRKRRRSVEVDLVPRKAVGHGRQAERGQDDRSVVPIPVGVSVLLMGTIS